MLVKILPNQVSTYKEVIDAALEASLPNFEECIRTSLYKELLMDLSQVWIYHNDEGVFEGVLITQVRDNISAGAKTLTLVCFHAPEGTQEKSFMNSWPTLQAFGKSQDCVTLDFYSNNPEIIKYARLFNVLWETKYFQIDLNN